jgi:hypothetical protein
MAHTFISRTHQFLGKTIFWTQTKFLTKFTSITINDQDYPLAWCTDQSGKLCYNTCTYNDLFLLICFSFQYLPIFGLSLEKIPHCYKKVMFLIQNVCLTQTNDKCIELLSVMLGDAFFGFYLSMVSFVSYISPKDYLNYLLTKKHTKECKRKLSDLLKRNIK